MTEGAERASAKIATGHELKHKAAMSKARDAVVVIPISTEYMTLFACLTLLSLLLLMSSFLQCQSFNAYSVSVCGCVVCVTGRQTACCKGVPLGSCPSV